MPFTPVHANSHAPVLAGLYFAMVRPRGPIRTGPGEIPVLSFSFRLTMCAQLPHSDQVCGCTDSQAGLSLRCTGRCVMLQPMPDDPATPPVLALPDTPPDAPSPPLTPRLHP